MAMSYDVEIIAADRKLYSGSAISVTLPGMGGYFGILRGHAPLIAALDIGEIMLTIAENIPPKLIAVAGGFAEVNHDHLIVLADAAELAEEIDIERARLAVQRAEERLKAAGEGTDVDRAHAALMRAINRLRVAEGKGL